MAELLAAIRGISALPKGWDGTVYTDSKVTMWRLTTGKAFNGIPNSLRLQTLKLRKNRKWRVELVAGHPNEEELKTGYAVRNGLPVSKWNVACDLRCQQLAKQFLSDW